MQNGLYSAMVEYIYELSLYEKVDKQIGLERQIPAPKIDITLIMRDPHKQQLRVCQNTLLTGMKNANPSNVSTPEKDLQALNETEDV